MPKSLPYTKIQIPTLTLHFHSPKLREFKIILRNRLKGGGMVEISFSLFVELEG